MNSKSHIKHIKTNKFNSYIHELEGNYHIPGRTLFEEPNLNSLVKTKKKKISKRATKSKSTKSREVFTHEDFIIRLPSDLFEKEANHINYNISTNGLNSMESTLLKIWAGLETIDIYFYFLLSNTNIPTYSSLYWITDLIFE